MQHPQDIKIRTAVLGETERCQRIEEREAWYEGTAYETGPLAIGRNYDWEEEFYPDRTGPDGGKVRIPLEERKPIQYNVAAHIVDTSVGWLAGEEHWPAINCEDPVTADWLAALADNVQLAERFQEFATDGGKAGSAVATFKIVDMIPVVEILPAKYCKPQLMADGRRVKALRYQFKAPGSYFVDDLDYTLAELPGDPDANYWYRREIHPNGETVYALEKVDSQGLPPRLELEDEARSITHGLDLPFVAVWVKNLPSKHPLDGDSSYERVMDLFHPLNMLISVAYRSIKKLSDPTVAFTNIIEPDVLDKILGKLGRLGSSGGGALASPGGVDLMEMQGTGQQAALTWAADLRAKIAELSHTIVNNPEKLSGAAQSAAAMKLLHGPILELTGRLRMAYGPALVLLVRLMLMTVARYQAKGGKLDLDRDMSGSPRTDVSISLGWGEYFSPTPDDVQKMLTNLELAVAGKIISRKTAQGIGGPLFGVTDLDAERDQIEDEELEGVSMASLTNQDGFEDPELELEDEDLDA